jgi:hypothetical protein
MSRTMQISKNSAIWILYFRSKVLGTKKSLRSLSQKESKEKGSTFCGLIFPVIIGDLYALVSFVDQNAPISTRNHSAKYSLIIFAFAFPTASTNSSKDAFFTPLTDLNSLIKSSNVFSPIPFI